MEQLGELCLLPRHNEVKEAKLTALEDRKKLVRVIWDIHTCPLLDAHNKKVYDFNMFRQLINRGLKTVDSNLEAEEMMFAAGYPEDFENNQLSSDFLSSQGVNFVFCPRRKSVCRKKRTCEDTRKTGPGLFLTLQEHLLGNAVDHGPGITLLISADVDFIEAVDYLRLRGSAILLAVSENSLRKTFCDHGHYTWFWKNLRLGGRATYQCDDFQTIDPDIIQYECTVCLH